MSNEDKKYSIDDVKSTMEEKKKASKGRGFSFKPYVDDVRTRLKLIEEKKQKIRTVPGSEKLLEKLRKQGKWTARERLDAFFDKGTFIEEAIFVRCKATEMGMDKKYTPCDGVVCGYGKVDGRIIFAYATDYTVLAGSSGEGHIKKIANVYRRACDMRVPIVGFLDSAGVRMQEAGRIPGYGELYWLQSNYSGVIPQISIICGGVAAGQAYSPLLSDFVIMTSVNQISYSKLEKINER